MNVFHKVTLASLKRNRTRTTVTIVGIMLSTALMTAVTTSVSSLRQYLMEDEIARSGAWQLHSSDLGENAYRSLAENDEVKTLTYAEYVGYAEADSANAYKPYLYVLGMGENFTDLVSVQLISGHLPENSTELLLPAHLASNGGVYYNIGDTVTLELGDRMVGDYALGQAHPFTPEEEREGEDGSEVFVPRETRTYTVCGFMERPGYDFEDFAAPGYTCLTLDDGMAGDRVEVWYTVRHPNGIYDFVNGTEFSGTIHRDLLMYSGINRHESFTQVLYGMTAILIGLIVFGSVALIYNAFAISVAERTKQFGLLSSVGATKKQLRQMVRFEGLCVSTVGIPLGILLGITGITVTFLCIGGKIGAFTNSHTPMRLHISWLAMIVAIAVSLLTVRMSVWIPSYRATRVSAVDAIRQSMDVKIERHPKKTSKLFYKIFGLPGVLGQKYFRRSHKKYRTTILSLFMSVVLFISASAFTSYLQESVQGVFGADAGDLRYWCNSGETGGMSLEETASLFRAEPLVDRCVGSAISAAWGTVARDEIAAVPDAFSFIRDPEHDTDEMLGIYVRVQFVDTESYRALLKEYGLSEQTFMDEDSPKAVAVGRIGSFNRNSDTYQTLQLFTGRTCSFHAQLRRDYEGYKFTEMSQEGTLLYTNSQTGERVYHSRKEALIDTTLTAGAVLNERPDFVETDSFPIFLYPISTMDAVLGESDRPETLSFIMDAADHAGAYNSLHQTITEHHMSDNLYDHAAVRENEHNLISVVKVFSYGFIILISLIAAANVFNSISTNIGLRRREFAMLRSIGMTGKGLIRMMNYECILYGTCALLLGLPVSAGVTLLIWTALKDGFETGFHLPWGAAGIAVCSVFAVVFASMLYAMQKIRRDNPMDALKEENL